MIARLAEEKKLLVIEDSINSLLRDGPIPPIASFAPEQVVCLSSLSKTVSAGLIEDGLADEIIAERRWEIVKRNLIVNKILAGVPVAGELTSPLRYIQLPDYFTGKSFEICAQQAGVMVYGAERFAVGNKPV